MGVIAVGAPSTISVPPLALRIVHRFKGEYSNIGIDGARGASRHLFVYVTCAWFLWNKVEKMINYVYMFLICWYLKYVYYMIESYWSLTVKCISYKRL
jgi:hypothetical protein